MTTGTILDLVVIALLVPTIIYAVILNRRLMALRRSREELSKVVNSFNEATMRAEAGIPKLKKATTEANHTLKDRVEKAQTLRDDLAFMIERAEELAARLEGAVRVARAEGIASHVAPQAPATQARGSEPVRGSPVGLAATTLAQTAAGFEESAAELRNALGNALGAARAEARVSGPAAGAVAGGLARPKRGPERSLSERALHDRHERVEVAHDEDRSEAERELLKALQSAR
jgi:hypothetical protein